MTPTRARTLIAIAAICGLGTWLLLRVIYASLPPLPWTGVPALALLAIVEGWSGRSLRARLRARGSGRPVDPIAVARTAALAKASALVAAVFGGIAIGYLGYVSGSIDKSSPRADAFASGGTLAAAVILLLAALYLERSCRVPPSGPGNGPGAGSGNGPGTGPQGPGHPR